MQRSSVFHYCPPLLGFNSLPHWSHSSFNVVKLQGPTEQLARLRFCLGLF
jgi:hypothetical protein